MKQVSSFCKMLPSKVPRPEVSFTKHGSFPSRNHFPVAFVGAVPSVLGLTMNEQWVKKSHQLVPDSVLPSRSYLLGLTDFFQLQTGVVQENPNL